MCQLLHLFIRGSLALCSVLRAPIVRLMNASPILMIIIKTHTSFYLKGFPQ
jgi:hypothetical protein